MRQADGVRTAPRHKRELNNPIKLLTPVIVRFPIAIERQRLIRRLIDAQNIRAEFFVFDVEISINFVDRPQAIFVVAGRLAAFDLVVGNRRLAEFRVVRIAKVNVNIHARLNALQVLHLRDVLNVRLTFGSVEVRCCERQVNVVNRHELSLRTTALRVPHELHVLPAAQR